ncbi:olfactory receptor 7G1-like [Apodemus sylvaticus]|uniref:olfactory receptor 7G1-like n=1 Tax=Apodemus sylvaticus TaxID=10129 RepID=UPI002242D731|nr:olfactory receptor 7G1-like [Apodemus sylvaticus]
MEISNQSVISEFFLIGLTYAPDIESFIFSLFLSIYFVTIFGNIPIILAIYFDYHLHTPMYFFIANLSFTDICISTTIIPKMLLNIETQNQSITYTGCLSQVCFVLIFGGLESCLLAVMAYDRYLAIVHPLRYTVIMNPCLCVLLVLFSLFISTMNALLHSLMLLKLSFCKDQYILHFFCELVQVIRHACSDTFINTLLIYTVTSIFAGVPLVGIMFSYIQIVSSILKISSVQGRNKAFSTCGSHLSVVSLFYGTAFGVYMSSAVSDSSVKNMVFSMMYIMVPQMLNPFIYSLRNREMKQAMRHLLLSVVITSP